MATKFKIALFFTTFSKLSYGSIPKDKVLHFAAGATTGGVAYAITYDVTKNRTQSFWIGLMTSALVGFTKEIIDSQKTGQSFDQGDFMATVLGGLSITITFDLDKSSSKNR